jgi:FixJ family two-component response regulator
MSSSKNIYVAVVDDDESLRQSLSRLLRAAGFQPIAYPSAEAFLDDDKRPGFDCLVLDIRLGGMSGLELQKQLAASSLATPVVFITAHDDPKVREQAVAAGCAGCFRKSDSGKAVLAAIGLATQQRSVERGFSEPGDHVDADTGDSQGMGGSEPS